MLTERKKSKMKRTQISLTPEQLQAAKQLASKRQVSLSQVFRDALECVQQQAEQEQRDYFDAMWSIVGTLKNADPDASEKHDEILYGHGDDPHG